MSYTYQYPHAALTCDSLIFGRENSKSREDDNLFVLLIQRANEPYQGCWALPGGFMEIDETLEECAARELMEETRLSGIELHQLRAYSTVNRDPRERVVTVTFWGVVDKSAYTAVAGDDAAQAKWFNIEALPALAFDHAQMIADGLEALRRAGK